MADPVDREVALGSIRETIEDGYLNTLDIDGPNWDYIAERVFEVHMAPLLEAMEVGGRAMALAAKKIETQRADIASARAWARKVESERDALRANA